MALSQSVVSELLEAFRAGEGVHLIRESVQLVMQELIETEASERIGADRYERTETRVTDRNGSRPRLLARCQVRRGWRHHPTQPLRGERPLLGYV
jgi:putative transposase